MLKISLRPSWLLAGILLLAHGAAIAMVLLVNFPLWLNLIATALLIVNLTMVVRLYALLLAPGAAVAIEISSDNNLGIQTRALEWCDYDVLGSTYVMPYLAILNLRQCESHATKWIALLPDSLHAEDFRKLRVWLRWKEGNPDQ